MSKPDKNDRIDEVNWDKYEEDPGLLYSYLKKKGKHKRAKDISKNRSV